MNMSSMLNSQDSTEPDPTHNPPSVLVDRLFRLNEACLRVSKTLELDSALQEIADSACFLTGARYGVVALFDEIGGFSHTVTSGMEPQQLERMETAPVGNGLLGYLNETEGTLRVADIKNHPRSLGLPPHHPPMTSFLGVQVSHDGQHLGNIYLGEKQDEQEFTRLDEDLIRRFAEQAGTTISNSRRFERERKIKTDLKALVKIAPVGLVVFDARTGNILTVNEEGKRIAGESGMAAHSWDELLVQFSLRRADGSEIKAGDRPTMLVMQSGEVVRAEEFALHFNDGRVINTLVSAAPIYSDRGDIQSVVVAVQDMTPLEDAGRMRAEYLGLVSHELRMPLTTIKGSILGLKGIIESSESSEPLQLLQIADHQLEVMRNRINSLIELSHIEAGTLSLSLESADIPSLLSDAILEFRRNHPGFVVRQGDFTGLQPVMVDRDRISQSLRDMFSYVFKHASAASTVSVNAAQQDSHVEVSISINSDRAHSAEIPELVHRFRSTYGEDINQGMDGDGLALAICQGIITAHGGHLRAEKGECGHGMFFNFTMPMAVEPSIDKLTSVARTYPTADGTGDAATEILVCTDDPETRLTIFRTLFNEGYAPREAVDIAQVERLTSEIQPQLVLLDLTSRETSWFETINKLTTRHQVRVIAVVEEGDGERSSQATAKGADWCLVKPITPVELLARVRTPLNKQSQSRRIDPGDGYAVGQLTVNYASHTLEVGGQPVQLTATEYKLLFELSRRAGRVLTQEELLRRVWGPEYSGESQLLRAYVKSLRQKLGDNARDPSYIFTEHGTGYRMAKV